jgi:hypothetical protein
MTISRRSFLLGSATLTAAAVTFGGMPAWGVAGAPAVASAHFMQLSGLLVNHRLDAAVGARIAAAAAVKFAQSATMIDAIVRIATEAKAQQVEDFFDAIPAGPMQDFAHWIIFAWYAGCSSPAKDAQVFTFEHALTYQTTADAVAIPSYGFSGPNLWHRPIVPLSPMPSF